MRRRAGVGAIHKKNLEQEKYRGKGSELQENQLEQMSKQMDVFRVNLEEFAAKHKNDIKSNPLFRRQFQEMCAAIGVDPLISGKGFWSVLGIGDFYYELAVQIIEVCIATSPKNGGLITLEELRTRLIKARGQRKEHQEITLDDLLRAAKKLKVLGAGFSVVPIGKGQYLVQSVPGELSMDHTAVLHAASTKDRAYVSVGMLVSSLGWEQERAQKALDYMIKQGLSWIDTQDPNEPLYWFPNIGVSDREDENCSNLNNEEITEKENEETGFDENRFCEENYEVIDDDENNENNSESHEQLNEGDGDIADPDGIWGGTPNENNFEEEDGINNEINNE